MSIQGRAAHLSAMPTRIGGRIAARTYAVLVLLAAPLFAFNALRLIRADDWLGWVGLVSVVVNVVSAIVLIHLTRRSLFTQRNDPSTCPASGQTGLTR